MGSPGTLKETKENREGSQRVERNDAVSLLQHRIIPTT